MDCTSADDLSCDSDQEWDSFTAPTPPPAFHHEGLRRSALRLAMPSTPGAPSTAQAGHRLDPKRMGSRPDPGFTRRGGTASAPAALRRSRRSALIWRRPLRLARLRLRGPARGRIPKEWAPCPTWASPGGEGLRSPLRRSALCMATPSPPGAIFSAQLTSGLSTGLQARSWLRPTEWGCAPHSVAQPSPGDGFAAWRTIVRAGQRWGRNRDE